MSKKKRLFAICVAMITIPAFTMGDAPYDVANIVNYAYAVSTEMEPIRETHLERKDVSMKRENPERNLRVTTECGTEETTTSWEASTTLSPKTTETTTTTVKESQESVHEDVKVETTPTGVNSENEDPTEPIQPKSEPIVETESENVTEEAETLESDSVEETESETETETETIEEETEADTTEEFVWNGPYLNKKDGIVRASQTPSGYKETFYNLNMMGCLDLIGYSRDGYKVRDDGVKTYNGYVMVASPNLSAHPKGSLIPTTLGMGIVVDYCRAGNLDVAVTW